MTISDKLYVLERIFENQRSWINWANTSAAIGFVFEAIITFTVLRNSIVIPFVPRAIFIAFAVFSFLFYTLSIFPKINRQSSSFMYFGGIINYRREEFGRLIKNITDDDMEKEYGDQIHILAQIALTKFLYFRLGFFLSMASFALVIFFTF